MGVVVDIGGGGSGEGFGCDVEKMGKAVEK